MKRIIYAIAIVAAIGLFSVACKSDDDNNVAPPRDYAVQKAVEEKDIEDFLKAHYIEVDPVTMDVTIDSLDTAHTVSIKSQTEFELKHKMVTFAGQEYKVYYLMLREGVGDKPNRGDNVLAAYKGTLLNGTVFDQLPFPQNVSSLNTAILGWQEIIPEFREGVYSSDNPQNPASFTDYGAGVMFLPSALAYYNTSLMTAPAYSTMIFSFKLYRVEDGDVDGDGLLNKYELSDTDSDPANYDTDGDGIPNYRDTDDDNDGILTRVEITNQDTDEVYTFENIPVCPGGNGKKRHLDPTCDGL